MSLDDETEDRILEKATYIEEAVEILAQKPSIDRRTYVSNREQRDIVERECQIKPSVSYIGRQDSCCFN